nr:bifunctional (p)ppGpp synthetase/guanosine-3',5'-bis(diphosphate) 3'-pyrophosphohydrolase [Desulfobulbaceae bacterium]
MSKLQEILDSAGKYMPKESCTLIEKAYEFALKVYADNPDRLSGAPYISHPLSVAAILTSLGLDVHSVISGLLHKALRGKPPQTTKDELSKLFGAEVGEIVSGATKIDDIQFNSRLDYKAENVKKMFLAMSTDIRVLLVKLADHLHDMQTLEYVDAERRAELAQDSVDLYAPLASRLGIDRIKRELEDLSFQYLHPKQFAELNSKVNMSLHERDEFVEQIKSVLDKSLKENGLENFLISGRPKHLYSIYRKLIAQNISIDKVYDKVAFRVIVNTVGECYEVMGIVHALWQPIASRFKDFISAPKSNLYQSLHTSVVGPHGDFMEIQIRTYKMDEIANDGIAAHWAYKEGADISKKDAKLFHWLKQLVQNLKEVDDPKEFLDAVRVELDHAEVYALTPKGAVKELPIGSTPLDFAYSIHTEVGNRCTGAKIDGRIVPLKYEIQNGDVIEIITSPNQHPNQGWLALVKTSRAKNRVRHWLKQEEQEQFLETGREICERDLRKANLSLKRIAKAPNFSEALKGFNCNNLDGLLRRVASGKVNTQQLIEAFESQEIKEERLKLQAERDEADRLARQTKKPVKQRKKGSRSIVKIDGIDDVLVKISNCCMPMPGDSIVGFITAGRGVSVHKNSCSNLLASDPTRRIDVAWTEQEKIDGLKVKIQVIALDRKGLLVSVCNSITSEEGDIFDVEAHVSKSRQARLDFVLGVKGKDHLLAILQRISQMDGVLEAQRM